MTEASFDQLRAHYAKNADALQADADKIRRTGKWIRGYDAERMQMGADRMRQQSQMSDEELEPVMAVLRSAFARVAR